MDDLEFYTGLNQEWAHEFVTQSNRIDPQPGENEPGSALYDLHHAALMHSISAAIDDRYVLPKDLHKMLLPDHPQAGQLRTQHSIFGLRKMVHYRRVPHYTWRWNVDVRETIGDLLFRSGSPEERHELLWDLHCELMNIRPFELYNGRVGRLVMVNHALMLGIEPPLVHFEEREDYINTISSHPSATWVDESRFKASAVRYCER